MSEESRRIGFACAYTPLPLFHAAEFTPYRILPMGEPPDRAGRLLHDNLCPHVKRILDLALNGDHPDLSGMVIVNSCDAMRRLSDVWHRALPDIPIHVLDLPTSAGPAAQAYFAGELRRLGAALSEWSGRPLTEKRIEESADAYRSFAERLAEYRRVHAGSAAALQALYNRFATESLETAESLLAEALAKPTEKISEDGVPVFLFGNVMPDPEALALFESCGARIVADDLCTGSRAFAPVRLDGEENIYEKLARALLSRPPCARTLVPESPGSLALRTLQNFKESGAKGAIGHSVKFCDPYAARFPYLREVFREAGAPLLILEGDCTLRSIGQQRTRVEAYVEMLR